MKSRHTIKTTEGLNRQIRFDDKIKKATEKQQKDVPHKERQYGSELNMKGREAYFREYFEGVKLENQILEPIGPFTDIRETLSFRQGYQKGAFLVEQGIIPEEYKNIENNNLHR